MQNKRSTSSKLFGALLAGALCATPLVVSKVEAAPRHGEHRGDRGRDDNRRERYQTLTGVVTDVERNSFDLRVGKKTYEVRPSGRLPQQLSRNDTVRVYGQVDDDDVRNANVTIVRDVRESNGSGWGQNNRYQTMTGTVTDVERGSFDLRVGNKTYEVRPSGRMPQQLSRNDMVRIYGQVNGDDVRNANVTILRDNRDNNGNGWGIIGNRYQTLTGVVTDVERNSFDLRVGNKTYEVQPSGRLPQQLSRNDQVRVYGQVNGDDVRNANVTIVRDNRDNDRRNSQYRSLTGTVTDVERNSFDLRSGNKTYEVRPSGRLPQQLSRNDVVRVYGQIDDDDIRNANVVIVTNR